MFCFQSLCFLTWTSYKDVQLRKERRPFVLNGAVQLFLCVVFSLCVSSNGHGYKDVQLEKKERRKLSFSAERGCPGFFLRLETTLAVILYRLQPRSHDPARVLWFLNFSFTFVHLWEHKFSHAYLFTCESKQVFRYPCYSSVKIHVFTGGLVRA